MPWSRLLRINDPLLCRTAFLDSDFETFPTARGDFRVDIIQVHLNRLRIVRYRLSLPQVSAITIKPDRRVIGFLTETPSPAAYYRGTKILPCDVVVNKSDVAHQRTEADLSGGSMSLPVDELNTELEAVIGCDFPEKLDSTVVRPSPLLMSRLLELHKGVGQLAHDNPGILELSEVRRALEKQLIHLMIRCLAEGAGIETTTRGRRRNAIIARFEDFLAEHPDRPLYLCEICVGIGVAERTLRATCQEHLGMGPIRFLTLRRMHLVRRALVHAEPTETTVTRVVTDHGFWELGRFSVAYRTLFGESPSDTLRRPAEATEIYLKPPSPLPIDIGAEQLRTTLRLVGVR